MIPSVRFLVLACAAILLPVSLRADLGDLYVTNNSSSTTNGSVVRITAQGVKSTVASGLSRPFGIAMDGAGNIYTTDITAGTITKITPLGAVSTFATGLTSPRGLVSDLFGNLYVATNTTVTKVTSDGQVSIYDSGLSFAYDVTFDAAGNLYVDDFSFRRIYKYDAQGVRSLYTTLTGSGTTYGLAFNQQGDLFVSQGPSGSIVKVTPDKVQSTFTTGPGGFFQPIGLELNGAGELFTSTSTEVQKYSADGMTESSFATGLLNPGMLVFQTVPEPAGAGLLAFGAIVLAAGRRRAPYC